MGAKHVIIWSAIIGIMVHLFYKGHVIFSSCLLYVCSLTLFVRNELVNCIPFDIMYTYPSHTQYKIYLPLRIITSGLEPGLYITFLENHKINHSMSKLCSFIYYMPFEQRQLVRYIHHMVCN